MLFDVCPPGIAWWAGHLVSELFAWFGLDKHQPATGIELLPGFQCFFLAVGLDLHGGAGVSRLDHQFVEQSNGT